METDTEPEPTASSPRTPPLRDAVDSAIAYLRRCALGGAAPPALLTLDPRFERAFPAPQAREALREHLGADPGFDLTEEAFSSMLSLVLLLPPATPAERDLVAQCAAHVDQCRWRRRYRFFRGANGFPADTDCTAIAAGALHEHGLLSDPDFERAKTELFAAAASAEQEHAHDVPARDAEIHPGVFMVYWEDEAEPGTERRGRKHDAVACANALYTVHLGDARRTADARSVITATTRYLRDILSSRRYLAGTRYYPNPDVLLYAISRFCARFPQTPSAATLTPALRLAFHDLDAIAPARALAAETGSAMSTALRTLTAEHLDITGGQAERRTRLHRAQQPDGSWPACPYYRMGRFPLYFGSPYLTTLFAMRALRPREQADP